ncbi:MAG TPA: response regulator, partial [bacterium]
MELTFSDEDFQITSVGDGAQALDRARAERPDLVISDVGMPGLNGYELCERMKADPQLRVVPFLLLRGTFESFDEDRARACGADGIITKPFEAQEMVSTAKELIGRGATAAATAAAAETSL